MAYKDKDRQREAQREWVRQKRAKMKGSTGLKRGKDIRCFEDLPPDVQKSIISMSTRDGEIDEGIKARRTSIAIDYQHKFPHRFYSCSL